MGVVFVLSRLCSSQFLEGSIGSLIKAWDWANAGKGRVDGKTEPFEVYVWLGEGGGLGVKVGLEDVGPQRRVLFPWVRPAGRVCFALDTVSSPTL